MQDNNVFLPLYIFSLGLSSGLVGLFARRLLAVQGFAPNLTSSITVTAGVACAYIAVQCLYMMFLRIVKPARGGGPLLAESCSNAAALVLIPFLIGLVIPWPAKILFKVEPFLYLGVFGALHGFFKLMSLFAATQAPPANRAGALGWAATGLAAVFGLSLAFNVWNDALAKARIGQVGELQTATAGPVFAQAREIPEGVTFQLDVQGHGAQDMTLRWAPVVLDDQTPKSLHVTVELDGEASKPQVLAFELAENNWSEITIPGTALPANVKTCAITWSGAQIPQWVMKTGLRPVEAPGRTMWLSGPWFHETRKDEKQPNIVMLAVEGMASSHIGLLGYSRATTPALDEFGMVASVFANTYTNAPEPIAACMTLFTGVHPLIHHYLGSQQGPLPDTMQTLPEVLAANRYVTAAFTEGRAVNGNDLVFGSGFERGFEVFDDEYRTVAPPGASAELPATERVPEGSAVTLDKAADWIDAHRTHKYFVFIRLRELGAPRILPRYGDGFLGKGRTPTPKDIYDTVLLDIDRQIAAFLERLHAIPGFENTCLLITSTNGLDFSEAGRAGWRQGGEPKRMLTETALRVPLYLLTPGQTGRQRAAFITLEDVAPTLLKITNTAFSHTVTGKNIFEADTARQPISMLGEPLALSMRTGKWRYTWQSGRDPFSGNVLTQESPISLIDLDRLRAAIAQGDNLSSESTLAARFRAQLTQFLDANTTAAPADEKP